MAILLKAWILPMGEVAPGRICNQGGYPVYIFLRNGLKHGLYLIKNLKQFTLFGKEVYCFLLLFLVKQICLSVQDMIDILKAICVSHRLWCNIGNNKITEKHKTEAFKPRG